MISLVPWVSCGLTSLVWSWRSVMSPSGQQEVSSVSSSVSRAEKIKCSLQITEVIVYVPRGHFNQTCRDVFIPWLSWLEMFLTRSLVVWMFLTKPFQWFWRQQWWLFACKVRNETSEHLLLCLMLFEVNLDVCSRVCVLTKLIFLIKGLDVCS